MDHTRKRIYYKKRKKVTDQTGNPEVSTKPAVIQKKHVREIPDSNNVVRNNQMISVVIPLLNEEDSLAELSQGLEKVFDFLKCNYEVIFIDDRSTDNSFGKIKEIHRKNTKF